MKKWFLFFLLGMLVHSKEAMAIYTISSTAYLNYLDTPTNLHYPRDNPRISASGSGSNTVYGFNTSRTTTVSAQLSGGIHYITLGNGLVGILPSDSAYSGGRVDAALVPTLTLKKTDGTIIAEKLPFNATNSPIFSAQGISGNVQFIINFDLYILGLPPTGGTGEINIPNFQFKLRVINGNSLDLSFQLPSLFREPPVISTCTSVSGNSQTINLGTKNVNLIKENEEVDTGKTFTLTVNNCYGRQDDTNPINDVSQVYVTFSDGTTQGNTSNILSIVTGEGYAQGVGIKIYPQESSQAIKYTTSGRRLFGTADANTMVTNGTAISMEPTGSYGDGIAGATKTFNIKYVRTSSPESVAAGKVKATATFTFSYH